MTVNTILLLSGIVFISGCDVTIYSCDGKETFDMEERKSIFIECVKNSDGSTVGISNCDRIAYSLTRKCIKAGEE